MFTNSKTRSLWSFVCDKEINKHYMELCDPLTRGYKANDRSTEPSSSTLSPTHTETEF
jgi:hypothetical protein